MKCYFEISQAPQPNGRRRVKVVLHEIYPDNTKWNENGITYLEQYTRDNAESIKGMPLCAAFLDDEKEIPYDHGLTDRDGNMPIFEDSVQVGAGDDWSIEDIEIDGETRRVCCALGYVNEQRYPKFVKWLQERTELGIATFGSVEFVGTKENGEIVYDGGFKEEGRIPQIYDYSGYCFLTVRPSDDSAILLELNQSVKTEKQEVDTQMDEKVLSEIIDTVKAAVNTSVVETNSKNAEYEGQITELNNQIVELNASVEQLKGALADVEKERDENWKKSDELWKEAELLREEIAKAKVKERVGELNSALSDYSDEEKEYAKEDIEKFNADPLSVEINEIVTKIDATAYRKLKEAKNVEINESKKSFDIADIFSDVDSAADGAGLDTGSLFE